MAECDKSGCGCSEGVTFDGLSSDYRRRLWAVIAINASMFALEMGAGVLAGSQALQADALDFFGDTLTYGLSLAVIGLSLRVRATAAIVKGVSLALMGLWVFGSTIWHALVLGLPRAEVMGLIGFLALAANLASVLILLKYKDGDANVRSVWLCSRNDAVGNVAVMLAAVGVWGTGSGWPDVIVAALLAALFLQSAAKIVHQAIKEWRTATGSSLPEVRGRLPQRNAERLLSPMSASERSTQGGRIMRKFRFSLAVAAALTAGASLFGSAETAPIVSPNGLFATADSGNMIEDAHYVWAGKGYCWYDDGWNGAGWYRCGYASRSGKGWGGPQGWHDWYWQGMSGPQHWGHHYGMHQGMHHHGMHDW